MSVKKKPAKSTKLSQPKYSVKTMSFEERKQWVRNKYVYELSSLISEAEHQVRIKILSDPGTEIFGKPLNEIHRLVRLAEEGGTAAAYKKGFSDALGTIKRVAEQEISRLSA